MNQLVVYLLIRMSWVVHERYSQTLGEERWIPELMAARVNTVRLPIYTFCSVNNYDFRASLDIQKMLDYCWC